MDGRENRKAVMGLFRCHVPILWSTQKDSVTLRTDPPRHWASENPILCLWREKELAAHNVSAPAVPETSLCTIQCYQMQMLSPACCLQVLWQEISTQGLPALSTKTNGTRSMVQIKKEILHMLPHRTSFCRYSHQYLAQVPSPQRRKILV